MDPWFDIDLEGISNFIALRNRNPSARFLFSIGGWNAGSANFSRIANSPALRTTFVNSVMEVVNRHGFDGFDLDWVKK